MSLDKAIAHGKEHRSPYRGSKRFDPACRSNTCPYCLGNKLHAAAKRTLSALEQQQRTTDDDPEACTP